MDEETKVTTVTYSTVLFSFAILLRLHFYLEGMIHI
jgi:hypothetical protein